MALQEVDIDLKLSLYLILKERWWWLFLLLLGERHTGSGMSVTSEKL